MIVRSMSTPVSPDTRNAAGIATAIDAADVVRHQRLHDVGRVGAEHHQLAVRHVDDAHDAEGDGEADGDEHQHRAEARGRRTASRRRSRSSAPARCDRRPRRPRRGRRRRARRSCRPAPSRRAPSAGCGRPAAGAATAPAMAARRAGLSPPSRSASARPVSISRLDARVVLGADALAEQRGGLRRRASAACSVTAFSRTAGSALASSKRATRPFSTRRRRLLVPIARQRVARRRAGRLQRDGIEEVERPAASRRRRSR